MSWAHYIIQVNIYLVIFYGFYKLLLDNETYFVLNRIYLIAAGLFSLSIPFLRFEWFNAQPLTQRIHVGVDQLNIIMEQVTYQAPDKINWGSVIVLIYISGVIFCIARLIFQLLSISKVLKSIPKGTAFSFFNRKVVDIELPALETIHKHEDIHMRQMHTLDVLFFEILGAFIWFNPVVYLYKTTVKNIHEYLADEEAAKHQGNKEEYALLLLSNAFGIAPNELTNSFFNKSLIKKRIFMLHKPRSRKTAMLKYGLFLPLFAIALTLSSATIRKNDKLKEIAYEIPLDNPITAVKEVIITVPEGNRSISAPLVTDKTVKNKSPEWDDFYSFMRKQLRYPSKSQTKGIRGNSQIKFVISEGQVENLGTAVKLSPDCDAEVMRAVLSYQNFKDIPNGNYSLSVAFTLNGADDDLPFKNARISAIKGYTPLNEIVIMGYAPGSAAASSNDAKIYDFVSVERQPGFPGGMQGFYNYLKETVKYPAEAQKKNIQGKVYLSFTVELDGTLNDIIVTRKLGGGTDEEAVRVLQECPKWIPGALNGKNVRVKYNIPISFKLSKSTDKSDSPTPANQEKTGSINVKGYGSTIKGEDNEVRLISQASAKAIVIVDGKKKDKSAFNELDPNEIASISVLKDSQATSLYGEEGKDGAIIIATKKGTAAITKR